MNKRVLISGGNGFVGRETVRRLYDQHEVLVVDNLRTGPLRFRPEEASRFRHCPTDIADAAAVAGVMAAFRPEVIIHLAAIHYIPECEESPALAVRTNVDGTVALLAEAPPGARFVFASSGAVYLPDEAPHDEAVAALGPSDVYGITKLHGEHYVSYFAAKRQLSAVNVRLFNVVGPGETNPHLLPEIVAQLKAGRRVLRLGNMWPKRDYIHVRDAARGFVAAALAGAGEPGRTLTVNLGSSAAYSVAEIVEKLRRIVPMDFAVEQEAARQRNVDRPHLAADIRAIERLFGWRPQATLDAALVDIWQEPDLAPALVRRYAA
jgi:UDP-glucose 4-epimerase